MRMASLEHGNDEEGLDPVDRFGGRRSGSSGCAQVLSFTIYASVTIAFLAGCVGAVAGWPEWLVAIQLLAFPAVALFLPALFFLLMRATFTDGPRRGHVRDPIVHVLRTTLVACALTVAGSILVTQLASACILRAASNELDPIVLGIQQHTRALGRAPSTQDELETLFGGGLPSLDRGDCGPVTYGFDPSGQWQLQFSITHLVIGPGFGVCRWEQRGSEPGKWVLEISD